MKYEVVIGIETHVQLKTKSKLFCGCDNYAREAAPNTLICPVCMGMPGTLPVLNEEAVNLAIKAGLALNGQIAKHSKFDRKNYFYPDLPKGYQITQFDQPIVGKGHVEFPAPDQDQVLGSKRPGLTRVGITRAHLEEDAGKLTHPPGADYSLVDLNRAGTPLLEIVSEPDIRNPQEAKAYAGEIYNLMRYADVSEADLYYGNMRFDVNVSVRPAGSDKLGTRAEIKNLNSFRAVEKAAQYEFDRQVELLEKGGKVVQETRGWDDDKSVTYSQRSKEEAHDYRYFPEPDLPPLVIKESMIKEAKLPVMPSQLRKDLVGHGLATKDAEVIISNLPLVKLYNHAMQAGGQKHAKRIAGWLAGEVQRLEVPSEFNGSALVDLAVMADAGDLSSTAAKQVLGEMIISGQSAKLVAERLNLLQVSDHGELEKIVETVIKAQPKTVADYQAGKAAALGALVGQVMKASGGQANPAMVNAILKERLERR